MLKKIFNFFGYTYSKHFKSIEIKEIIRLRLKNNSVDILIDVGANQGSFSHALKENFKKIVLIEPNTKLFEELKKKFVQKKFEIYSFGTNNKNSFATLNITNDTGKSLSSIRQQSPLLKKNFRNTKIVKKFKIKLMRLDDFFNEINIKNKSLFIKIDTQGNDYETLQGLGYYIKNVKYILIEFNIIKFIIFFI